MIVLLSIPAAFNQRDKVEKTKRIGNPEENLKNKNHTTLISKYIEKEFKFFLINLNKFLFFPCFVKVYIIKLSEI